MNGRRHAVSPSVLAGALTIGLLTQGASAFGAGCLEDPRRAAIARAVGVWEVVSEAGVAEGLAEVRPILGGCAFDVVRLEDGVEVARALIYLDPVTDRWIERWVSRRGATARLEIEVAGEELYLTGTVHDGQGGATPGRLDFAPGPGDSFTRRLHLSLDGGETWEPPQVAVYRRRGSSEDSDARGMTASAPPATPQPSVPEATVPGPTAPAPTASEAPVRQPEALEPSDAASETRPGAVTVRSERTRNQPPAATVTLESPMMLEIELGPVDDLPAGTAWRTTETAVYLVDEIRMPQVTASRRERRGKIELEVTVNLRTTAMQRRVDIEVELLAGGVSLGRERADKIALGKLIGSHDPRVGRPTTLRFSLDQESFEALFADGKRPSARITVTVK